MPHPLAKAAIRDHDSVSNSEVDVRIWCSLSSPSISRRLEQNYENTMALPGKLVPR